MSFPPDRIGHIPAQPSRSTISTTQAGPPDTASAAAGQTSDTGGAGAVCGASARSTQQLEASVRELLRTTQRVIPGAVNWTYKDSDQRQLLRTRNGWAYQNCAEYRAEHGGLYIPAAAGAPLICSDMQQLHTWLTEVDTLLSMAAPDVPSVATIRATLRQSLVAANGNQRQCQFALGKAWQELTRHHGYTSMAAFNELELETHWAKQELSPQAAADTAEATSYYRNRSQW